MLRFARPDDAEALLAIYDQYIETPVTFEYELPSPEEFRRRITSISRDYPYLVYEADGKPAGYAYAHRHMERAAYQWNAELSVYLDRSCHGFGLGTKLYNTLMDILRLQGVRNVFGCVTLPNGKSEALHESLGFVRVGTYSMAGYKCDSWRDVCWYQKQIADYDAPPKPFRGIRDLEPRLLQRLLDEYNR